ncbi:hypothetical protein [Niveibacterium sp.]|uniref:hypothetical protein n=1 Tax=Niveibacterium sp. TaxID=2017444 RepID=UPI0035B415BB
MKFISLRVRPSLVVHGYTPDNTEIVEQAEDAPFADKIVAVERIQSVSDRYLLVTGSHGRVMYWEYEGGFDDVRRRLEQAGSLIA